MPEALLYYICCWRDLEYKTWRAIEKSEKDMDEGNMDLTSSNGDSWVTHWYNNHRCVSVEYRDDLMSPYETIRMVP